MHQRGLRNRNDFERLRFERHVLAMLIHWYVQQCLHSQSQRTVLS